MCMIYRHLHALYLYMCRPVYLDPCNCDKIVFAELVYHNSPCQRDLWLCSIIKPQLSTVENPIPFLLILLLFWYISRVVFSVGTKTQQKADSDVRLNYVEHCYKHGFVFSGVCWIILFSFTATAILRTSPGVREDAVLEQYCVFLCDKGFWGVGSLFTVFGVDSVSHLPADEIAGPFVLH